MTIRSLGRALGILTIAVGLAVPATASADVYWQNRGPETPTVGLATTAGTNVDQKFLNSVLSRGLTVTNTHVYWAGSEGIGRAGLDGTGLNGDFIRLSPPNGGSGPPLALQGIAADDSHIFWSREVGVIGRATVDGTNIDTAFLTAAAGPLVVVDGHLYWGDATGDRIGRVALDGGNPQPGFITGVTDPISLATDGTHLYWASNFSDSIGRVGVDGSDKRSAFITDTTLAPDPTASVASVAVADGYLFWGRKAASDGGASSVGRAKLDGSDVRPEFIPASDPWYVAAISSQTIDFPALPSTALDAGPVTLGATASSGLSVSYTSSSPSVCAVSGSQVTLTATGNCSITASQAGNNRYLAAANLTRTFAVTPAPTPKVRPAPVSGLKASARKRTLKLRWNASPDATSYRVRLTYKRKILSRVTMGRTAKFTRLKPKKRYTACVVAANPDYEQFSATRCVVKKMPRRR